MNIIDLTKDYFHSLAQELTTKVPDMPSLAKNLKVQRITILVVAAMLLSGLLAPEINFSPPHFKVGSIAPKDIKADRDFLVEDRASTEQKKRESFERTRSVYDYDDTYTAKFIPSIPASFSKMRIACANLENARLADIQGLSGNKTFNAAKMDFERLQGLIVEGLGVEKEKVTLEADLVTDLGADSLDAVELIMAIEDEFDLTIDDEVAQSFKTVGQIVEFIDSKLK